MKREELRAAAHRIKRRLVREGDNWETSSLCKEVDELAAIALRATEPDMVLVPRDQLQRLHNHVLATTNESTEAFNVFLDMKEAKVFFPDN